MDCSIDNKDCGGKHKARGLCLRHYRIWKNKNKAPEYRAWEAMKNRCRNPNYFLFFRYGGRGIKVCERWLHSYDNFVGDLGERPTPQHSLDRINNDGDYEPSNCQWATKFEQSNNRRNVYTITLDGETKSLKQWCLILKLPYKTIHARVKYLRWPIKKALELTNG